MRDKRKLLKHSLNDDCNSRVSWKWIKELCKTKLKPQLQILDAVQKLYENEHQNYIFTNTNLQIVFAKGLPAWIKTRPGMYEILSFYDIKITFSCRTVGLR